MTILGIGSDIVEVKRVERSLAEYGEKFMQRMYHASEQKEAKTMPNDEVRIRFLAKRFAAKEAYSKAVGTGIGAFTHFNEICVIRLPTGKPTIEVFGQTADYLKQITPNGEHTKIDLSLSDDVGVALAFVVISTFPDNR